MKTIESIKLWKDGATETATILNMYISFDDLNTTAVFYYDLLSDTFVILAEGKITMTGADYQNWDDSNDAAYAFAATELNLVITGEYIPPIVDEQPA